MSNPNIKTLLYSDSSNELVDKVNNNFDEIVEFHGGTEGILGPTGDRGALGEIGPVGPTGIQGPRGTRWFIQSLAPAGPAQEGDYWIDSDTTQIFLLENTGWVYTGFNVNVSGNLFVETLSSFTPGLDYPGGTGISVGIDQILPENFLLILGDKSPEAGFQNENLSKFVVSTDSTVNDAPLLEFSKSDVENGNISDYSKHPVFKWGSPDPTDNSLVLQVPGGSAHFGMSGGFRSTFNNLVLQSASSINLDYGATSVGGIYSTGGFSFEAPNGSFNINSQFLRITGSSGEFRNPASSVTTQSQENPVVSVVLGGTSGFLSTRTGDSHSTLSHTVNHLSLESQNRTELYLNTKGKLRTNKTSEATSYPSREAGATGSAGTRLINWYFISKSSVNGSCVLENGNTVVISPSVTTGFIGVGFYYNPADNFGWGATSSGGLRNGESMDVRVYLSSESWTSTFGGISYLGFGATSGSAVTRVSLPFRASVVDFTIAKGVTGPSATTVYYKAYGITGGSGGSFTF